MRGDRDNLETMVSRVQHWLVCKRWKKVIYGAISVQKRMCVQIYMCRERVRFSV